MDNDYLLQRIERIEQILGRVANILTAYSPYPPNWTRDDIINYNTAMARETLSINMGGESKNEKKYNK